MLSSIITKLTCNFERDDNYQQALTKSRVENNSTRLPSFPINSNIFEYSFSQSTRDSIRFHSTRIPFEWSIIDSSPGIIIPFSQKKRSEEEEKDESESLISTTFPSCRSRRGNLASLTGYDLQGGNNLFRNTAEYVGVRNTRPWWVRQSGLLCKVMEYEKWVEITRERSERFKSRQPSRNIF